MGDEYPAAEVTGIDLSPIQSPWVPPNVKFLVDDAEAAWLYRHDSLDLVHLRNMSTAIKDWPALFAQAYRYMMHPSLTCEPACYLVTNPLYGQDAQARWLD